MPIHNLPAAVVEAGSFLLEVCANDHVDALPEYKQNISLSAGVTWPLCPDLAIWPLLCLELRRFIFMARVPRADPDPPYL